MTKALATVFTALLSVDGILTYWAIHSGRFIEQNPLMAPLADSIAFPIYKILTSVLAVVLVAILVRRFPRFRTVANLGFISGIVLYVLVLCSNLWEVMA